MKKKSRPATPGKRAATAGEGDSTVTNQGSFPIIGVGASAGGLEALEQFLSAVPKDCGMAFVIVQHLDPTRKGVMSELLQRVTSMAVMQVKDRTAARPNCVYVIPPNKDLSLLHGVLHLLEPAAPRGLRLPIDFFFRSLAQDRKERSVGVILSGMGSDGTLGLRAIKDSAGMALVQEPETAKFDSMPRSAIEAGLADYVAPVKELAEKLDAYLHRPRLIAQAEPTLDGKTQGSLDKVMLLLRAHSGNDFSFYKRNTLQRRIERRMGIHKIAKSSAYVRFLQENPQELELLFKEMLIGVTNFFRDPVAWKALRTALPSLLASRSPGQTLRAWVPGCSSGEEAYSLAIELKEAVDKARSKTVAKIQIFATDLDRDAIERARLGVFPAAISAEVPKDLLKRYFTKVDRGYRVCKEIRNLVTFAPQNLIMDPPFTKLDILSCRNLLIYLTAEIQKKLIPLFHYSLTPGGLFFQGSAETVGDFSDLFKPVNAKARLFRRTECALRLGQVDFPTSFCSSPAKETVVPPPHKTSDSLQSLADRLVLDNYVKPVVLTNDKGDIFYVSGRTGKYLEPAAGKANWNLFAMARGGLRYAISRAFPAALRHKNRVTLPGVKIETDSGTICVDVTIQRLNESGPLQGLVTVVFTEVPPPLDTKTSGRQTRKPVHSVRIAQLERELLRFQGEARAADEEMQTSQEELRSTNEELQSTNEEMQSSNEELTTSKEEIQSMNEELQTLNAELQAKVDDLSRTSNDMKNLLDSTDIATLFLDKELKVRRFTPRTTAIIKLIAADVGRPITDLASELSYPELANDARTVLRTLTAMEKTIGARSECWYTIRIMPYRTQDDKIDGVVITFADITVAKALEAKLRGLHIGPNDCGAGTIKKPAKAKTTKR